MRTFATCLIATLAFAGCSSASSQRLPSSGGTAGVAGGTGAVAGSGGSGAGGTAGSSGASGGGGAGAGGSSGSPGGGGTSGSSGAPGGGGTGGIGVGGGTGGAASGGTAGTGGTASGGTAGIGGTATGGTGGATCPGTAAPAPVSYKRSQLSNTGAIPDSVTFAVAAGHYVKATIVFEFKVASKVPGGGAHHLLELKRATTNPQAWVDIDLEDNMMVGACGNKKAGLTVTQGVWYTATATYDVTLGASLTIKNSGSATGTTVQSPGPLESIPVGANAKLRLRIGDTPELDNLEYKNIQVDLVPGNPSCAAVCAQ